MRMKITFYYLSSYETGIDKVLPTHSHTNTYPINTLVEMLGGRAKCSLIQIKFN